MTTEPAIYALRASKAPLPATLPEDPDVLAAWKAFTPALGRFVDDLRASAGYDAIAPVLDGLSALLPSAPTADALGEAALLDGLTRSPSSDHDDRGPELLAS